VFTTRYALSPYIKQIRFVFKGLIRLSISQCLFKCTNVVVKVTWLPVLPGFDCPQHNLGLFPPVLILSRMQWVSAAGIPADKAAGAWIRSTQVLVKKREAARLHGTWRYSFTWLTWSRVTNVGDFDFLPCGWYHIIKAWETMPGLDTAVLALCMLTLGDMSVPCKQILCSLISATHVHVSRGGWIALN
jgi:hypothetical protein